MGVLHRSLLAAHTIPLGCHTFVFTIQANQKGAQAKLFLTLACCYCCCCGGGLWNLSSGRTTESPLDSPTDKSASNREIGVGSSRSQIPVLSQFLVFPTLPGRGAALPTSTASCNPISGHSLSPGWAREGKVPWCWNISWSFERRDPYGDNRSQRKVSNVKFVRPIQGWGNHCPEQRALDSAWEHYSEIAEHNWSSAERLQCKWNLKWLYKTEHVRKTKRTKTKISICPGRSWI